MSEPIGRNVREIEIRDDMIRLGQFLKLANVMESGGESKELIADGEVAVNGDVVSVLGETLRVR